MSAGRGSPPVPDLTWEVDETYPYAHVLTICDHWAGGGISAWGYPVGSCDPENPHTGTRCWTTDPGFPYSCTVYPVLAFWFSLAPYTSLLPIVLNIAPSFCSYPTGVIAVYDCTVYYEEDRIDPSDCFGCVIGGQWTGPRPFLEGGPSAAERTSWSSVKALYR